MCRRCLVDHQHWFQWSSYATEAEKIKLNFPDCMQLRFLVQIKSCHLDALSWDLKSESEVYIMPYFWDEIASVPSPGLRMLRENCGGSSGRIPHSSVQVGLAAAAYWSQLSSTWIVARTGCYSTFLKIAKGMAPWKCSGNICESKCWAAPPSLSGLWS